jgi:hypothetical protein
MDYRRDRNVPAIVGHWTMPNDAPNDMTVHFKIRLDVFFFQCYLFPSVLQFNILLMFYDASQPGEYTRRLSQLPITIRLSQKIPPTSLLNSSDAYKLSRKPP